MFPLIKLIFTLAASKRGRRALRMLVVYLNSDQGRRLLGQARKVATGPEAQRVARQLATLLRSAAAKTRTPRARPAAAPRSRLATFAATGRRAAKAADRARQRARSAKTKTPR
jgi:hypothetical protein